MSHCGTTVTGIATACGSETVPSCSSYSLDLLCLLCIQVIVFVVCRNLMIEEKMVMEADSAVIDAAKSGEKLLFRCVKVDDGDSTVAHLLTHWFQSLMVTQTLLKLLNCFCR